MHKLDNVGKGAMEHERLTAEDLRWLHSLDLAISICTRMKELNLSKNEVAERAGIKPSALSRIISGEQNLTLSTIAKLEHALDVRFDAGFRYETEWKGLAYSASRKQAGRGGSRDVANNRFSSKRMDENSETSTVQKTKHNSSTMRVAS